MKFFDVSVILEYFDVVDLWRLFMDVKRVYFGFLVNIKY